MRTKYSVAWFSLFLLAAATILPTPVVAHDASTFTIIVREGALAPNSPQLNEGDAVFWYNVDDREDITHRIVYDGDGDGLFNGSLDWDSGELVASCPTDENGSTDPSCNVTFEVTFNGSLGSGTYHYCDLLSDGTVLEGVITIAADEHDDEEHAHDEDDDHGDDDAHAHGDDDDHAPDDHAADGEDGTTLTGQGEATTQNWLLLVAIVSGIAAVLLIISLMSSKDDLLREEDEPADSDINAIAEEE
jgi:hypothetical protein